MAADLADATLRLLSRLQMLVSTNISVSRLPDLAPRSRVLSIPWQLPDVQLQHSERPDPSGPRDYYPFDRYAASHFLCEIVPPHCLTHIRFLELVFPPYVPHGWPRAKHSAAQDWSATVSALRDYINAPALTIRLVMADFHVGVPFGREVMTKPRAKKILDGHICVMDPLIPLVQEDGLAAFYMEGAHPLIWLPDTLDRSLDDDGLLTRMRRRMKEISEKYVRGDDISPGSVKPEPRRSTWWFWYD
ncbi:hypothetical protein F5144DRAFT_595516 [Chaetomium tenue]|uniref:Uncharacterized protein n=1 Tax=Chaetomium tenue TaxID=1854479 RepID=A0ACB7P0D7_9PEZI|nr:hypothetical protein F5144DRAFT_595516 [Chaetomium globosum]